VGIVVVNIFAGTVVAECSLAREKLKKSGSRFMFKDDKKIKSYDNVMNEPMMLEN
jgi:hypothetical protein